MLPRPRDNLPPMHIGYYCIRDVGLLQRGRIGAGLSLARCRGFPATSTVDTARRIIPCQALEQ